MLREKQPTTKNNIIKLYQVIEPAKLIHWIDGEEIDLKG